MFFLALVVLWNGLLNNAVSCTVLPSPPYAVSQSSLGCFRGIRKINTACCYIEKNAMFVLESILLYRPTQNLNGCITFQNFIKCCPVRNVCAQPDELFSFGNNHKFMGYCKRIPFKVQKLRSTQAGVVNGVSRFFEQGRCLAVIYGFERYRERPWEILAQWQIEGIWRKEKIGLHLKSAGFASFFEDLSSRDPQEPSSYKQESGEQGDRISNSPIKVAYNSRIRTTEITPFARFITFCLGLFFGYLAFKVATDDGKLYFICAVIALLCIGGALGG